MRKREKLFMKKLTVYERQCNIDTKRLLYVTGLDGNRYSYHMLTNNAERMATNLPYRRNYGQEN